MKTGDDCDNGHTVICSSSTIATTSNKEILFSLFSRSSEANNSELLENNETASSVLHHA